MIDEKVVRHVAKLARMELGDEEIVKFAGQLDVVFSYVDVLKEVDVEGVEGTSQVTGLSNVMDEDKLRVSPSTREELLGCSELPIDSKQIRVKKSI